MSDDPEHTLRVYICCARADLSFATDLMTGLNTCGFDARTSHQATDIPPSPEALSKAEQEDRIANSDTIVFVLSPDALQEGAATTELEMAYHMGKRIFLAPIRQISSSQAPDAMLQMPFVSFQGDTSFAVSLSQLVSKLKTDIPWIKEHTRIALLANKWNKHGRSSTLLMYGKDLQRATSWARNIPKHFPPITKLEEAFLAASQKAFNDSIARARKPGPSKLSMVAISALAAITIFIGIKWQGANQLATSLQNEIDLISNKNSHLEDVQTRLYSDIRLKLSSEEDSFLSDIQGWYPRAASHAGSIARITFPPTSTNANQAQQFTGIIVAGDLLGQAYQGKSFILTPTFNRSAQDDLIASHFDSRQQTPKSNANFHLASETLSERVMLATVEPVSNDTFNLELPALHGDPRLLAQDSIWESQVQNGNQSAFSLHEISNTLPQGARALSFGDLDCRKFSRIKSLDQSLPANTESDFEPIGMMALAPAQQGFSSARGHASSGLKNTQPFATLQISKMKSEQNTSYISYNAATILPETGAPIFNLTTGKIIALHIGQSQTDPDTFEGVSLISLLNEVRADLSVPTSNLNSVCETY
ncbi:toll/interleukin-1 receptor domain-containing protein [Hirschia litorea]|uniref:Toll/interleukin-1 receptor domain-containing protein n=1 Tax=Hirschia litorea TaxID=1199156 RepID=A0ABW2ILB3_9PROT